MEIETNSEIEKSILINSNIESIEMPEISSFQNKENSILNFLEYNSFDKITDIYRKNKHKKWNEWLEVEKIFKRSGKQGIVGLFKILNTNYRIIFKISQDINYLVNHENNIIKSINKITYCPHFCKGYGDIFCDIDACKRKDGNPFDIESKYKIEKEVLLLEYIEDSYKFFNYISNKNSNEDIIYSIIKQTILSLLISQNEKQFTHYDLHSNNVLLKDCDKNLVMLYVINNEEQFCVPTLGKYPIIIDYGFSFSKDVDSSYLYGTLKHTEVGFFPNTYDKFADPKLFLVSVSNEIKEYKNTKKSKKLRNIVKSIFGNLKIDWISGWDNFNNKCAIDYITKLIKEEQEKNGSELSKFFEKYTYESMDILQSLIILPLENQSCKNLFLAFDSFFKEFEKIEKQIVSEYHLIYILKGIVDSAREIREDYESLNTRDVAIQYFKSSIIEKIDSITKYVKLNLNYEKMLCSLFLFSRCMEGTLFIFVNELLKKKQKQYSRIPLQNIQEMFTAIDVNIKDDYIFNENTVIYEINCINKECKRKKLSKNNINEINSYDSIYRGKILYKMIKD
jgi:hypothetical protein